eukprot:768473-Hanusia_phi.AAC.13
MTSSSCPIGLPSSRSSWHWTISEKSCGRTGMWLFRRSMTRAVYASLTWWLSDMRSKFARSRQPVDWDTLIRPREDDGVVAEVERGQRGDEAELRIDLLDVVVGYG